MNRSYFLAYVLLIPLLAIQIVLVPIVSLENVVPDLLLVLLVFFALRHGQMFGIVFGFIIGLCYDFATGGLLGSMMFAKTITGFVAGFFYNENKTELYLKSYRFALILLLCSAINSVALSLITNFNLQASLLVIILQQGLLPAIYTALIGIIITFFYPGRTLDWQG